LAIIKAPNKQYSGVSASLSFVNGQAETDDRWLIGWFKNRGYEVIDDQEKKRTKKRTEQDQENAEKDE